MKPGDTYGFYLEAENLGGYSLPSSAIQVGPTPICTFGVFPAGAVGALNIAADDQLYVYVQNMTTLPDLVDGGAPSINFNFVGTSEDQTQTLWPALQPPTDGLDVFLFSDGPGVPIGYDLVYASTSDAPASYSVTSDHCY